MKKIICVLIILGVRTISIGQPLNSPTDTLIRITSDTGKVLMFGYVNSTNDTIIPLGKYQVCYTDYFKTCAVVLTQDNKLIAIDRSEKKIFDVFAFNPQEDAIGTDDTFRFIENGKIGYADYNGNIMIPAIYACARAFVWDRQAQVSLFCNKCTPALLDCSDTFMINLKGERVK